MRSLLLTFSILLLFQNNIQSQETKVVFISHQVGQFYIYLNESLINRAPKNQVEISNPITYDLQIKVVFQDHNINAIQQLVHLKRDLLNVFVIHSKEGVIHIEKQKKANVGQYLPGLYSNKPNNYEYQGRLGCEPLSNTQNIDLAIQQIESEINSMAQVTIALDLIKNNCITVFDLKRVLTVIHQESDKIELAKYAWPYIFDQENYFQISNIFSNPNTISEIYTFVRSNQ